MRSEKTKKNTRNKTVSAASGRSVIGIDIGQYGIRMVQLSGRNLAQPVLEKYAVVSLPKHVFTGSEITDYEQFVSYLQQCYGKLKTNSKQANLALPSSKVTVEEGFIYRSDSEISLKEAVELEVAQIGALDEINYDWQVLSENSKEKTVLVVAAKKEDVEKCNDLLEEVGLTAINIDVDFFAMANAFSFAQTAEYNEIDSGKVAMFEIGDTTMKALIIEDGNILYKHESNFGLEQLIQQIQMNYQIGESEALAMLTYVNERPADFRTVAMDGFNMQIAQEIQRVMQFFYATQNIDVTSNIKQILISGSACVVDSGVVEAIYGQTSIATQHVNPVLLASNKSRLDETQLAAEASSLTIAFGLALRGLA